MIVDIYFKLWFFFGGFGGGGWGEWRRMGWWFIDFEEFLIWKEKKRSFFGEIVLEIGLNFIVRFERYFWI